MYLCFIFYLNYLLNLNTYVLLSIKSIFLFWRQTCTLFSFLEILAKPSWFLTFSTRSCKAESRADHRGHVGLCGLSAISELKRTIILSARASASVSRTMFIHPNRFPFHRFSVICWTVWFGLFTSWLPRVMWQPRACDTRCTVNRGNMDTQWPYLA